MYCVEVIEEPLRYVSYNGTTVEVASMSIVLYTKDGKKFRGSYGISSKNKKQLQLRIEGVIEAFLDQR